MKHGKRIHEIQHWNDDEMNEILITKHVFHLDTMLKHIKEINRTKHFNLILYN